MAQPSRKAIAVAAEPQDAERERKALIGARAAVVTGVVIGVWAALQPWLAGLR